VLRSEDQRLLDWLAALLEAATADTKLTVSVTSRSISSASFSRYAETER